MRRSTALLLCCAVTGLTACDGGTAVHGSTTTAGPGTAFATTEPTDTAPPNDTADPNRCNFDYRTQLSMLDPSTGALTWTADVPYDQRYTPLVMGGLAYSLTPRGIVTAVDLATGNVVWSWETDGGSTTFLRGAMATDDAIAVVTSRRVVGLDPATGDNMWQHDFPNDFNQVGATKATAELLAVAHSDLPFVPIYEDGEVLALDPASGDVLWRSPATKDWSYGPTVEGDQVVQPSFEDGVTTYDATTGAEQWRWSTRPGVGVAGVLAANDDVTVYATERYPSNPSGVEPPADAQQLVALDRATGAVRWTLPADVENMQWWAATIVGPSLLVPGSVAGADVVALTAIEVATGRIEWTWPLDRNQSSRVSHWDDGVLLSAYLLVGSEDPPSTWIALAADGTARWFITSEFEARHVLQVDGTTLVAGARYGDEVAINATDVGAVQSIDPASGAVRWTTPFRDAAQWMQATPDGVLVMSSDDMLFCD
jgi:outer membrane protein assembly factor BamB